MLMTVKKGDKKFEITVAFFTPELRWYLVPVLAHVFIKAPRPGDSDVARDRIDAICKMIAYHTSVCLCLLQTWA